MASVTNSSDKIEFSRMLTKRTAQTGEVPTIPPITANTLNLMIPTDLFVGEFFLNEVDDLLWIRTENGILPISLSGSTGSTGTQTLTQVLFEGNATNGYDIEVSNGDTIVYSGLSTGTTTKILGIDDNGRTIITSVSGGTGSGTSGTSGISGTSGTDGTSGTSGTSGISPTGDTLWTSGSTIGTLTNVAGTGNTNTNQNTLVVGYDNNLTTNFSPGIRGNIVIGSSNTSDSTGIGIFGVNNSMTNGYYNFIFGAANSLYNNSYSAAFGGNHIMSGGSYNFITGQNSGNLGSAWSSIIGGDNNKLIGTQRSVIIGGEGITASLIDDMVLVPNLTIVSATTGTSVATLAIDATGKVIKTTIPSGTSGTSGTSGISPTDDTLWTSGTTLGSLTNVAGTGNTNTSPYTLVVGNNNVVSGETDYNFVSGDNNTITNGVSYASIVGGRYNTIKNYPDFTSIMGGQNNEINSGFWSSIIGGHNNMITSGASSSAIIGGINITGTTPNMVYVPNLTIANINEGAVLYNLSLDSSGQVIRTTARLTINNTSDANFNLDGSTYKYATWIVGNSATARTLRISLIPIGEEVAVFIQNTNVGNKTFNINYELLAFRITNGIGATITSITLAQNQGVTLVVRNINGTIIGSI